MFIMKIIEVDDCGMNVAAEFAIIAVIDELLNLCASGDQRPHDFGRLDRLHIKVHAYHVGMFGQTEDHRGGQARIDAKEILVSREHVSSGCSDRCNNRGLCHLHRRLPLRDQAATPRFLVAL
jgi:hypothetical protein